MRTWAQERQALESLLGTQLPEETWEILRRDGAAERHTARVEHILDVVLEHISGDDRGSVALARLMSRLDEVHSWADVGRLLGSGARTDEELGDVGRLLTAAYGQIIMARDCAARERPGWGVSLGKGRPHATDGAAWTAALSDAACRMDSLLRIAALRGCLEPLSEWGAPDDEAVAEAGKDPAWKAAAVEHLSRRLASWRRAMLESSVSPPVRIAGLLVQLSTSEEA